MTEYEKTEQAYKNGYAKGFEDGKPKWIPVTEGLPGIHSNYIVMIEGAIMPTELWFVPDEMVWRDAQTGEVYEVSHWMPLPEAPKEG